MNEATTQIVLPYEAITPDQLAGKFMAREMLTRGGDTYWIEFERIIERDYFNPRYIYNGIEELADKIKVNGLVPLTVDFMADGRAYVEKGHRRFKALTILWLEGTLATLNLPGIKEGKVLCFINGKEVTELDRIKNALSDNDSEPLNPVEQADCIWRMKNLFHMSTDEIKAATGLSRQHIDNRLLLAEQSPIVKECINKGLVKATTVTKAARQLASPEKTEELIMGMTKSKTRVRGTDVDELIRQEKKEIAAMEAEAGDEEKQEVFDENREELAWCQNVIRNIDKVSVMVDKVENEQLVKDLQGLLRFMMKDMQHIRSYVKTHKR